MGSRITLSDCYENSQFKDSTKVIVQYELVEINLGCMFENENCL